MLWRELHCKIFLLLVILCIFHALAPVSSHYVSQCQYKPEFHPARNPQCRSKISNPDFNAYVTNYPDNGEVSPIEIKAILMPCLVPDDNSTNGLYNYLMNPTLVVDLAQYSIVKKCQRKIAITVKLFNVGKTKTEEQFVIIDHVIDSATMEKSRLLDPFAIKIRQTQLIQLYRLQFKKIVNAEASEEVINNKWANFSGCDDSISRPTCGQTFFHGVPVPDSQGFCCSCDDETALKTKYQNDSGSYMRPSTLLIQPPIYPLNLDGHLKKGKYSDSPWIEISIQSKKRDPLREISKKNKPMEPHREFRFPRRKLHSYDDNQLIQTKRHRLIRKSQKSTDVEREKKINIGSDQSTLFDNTNPTNKKRRFLRVNRHPHKTVYRLADKLLKQRSIKTGAPLKIMERSDRGKISSLISSELPPMDSDEYTQQIMLRHRVKPVIPITEEQKYIILNDNEFDKSSPITLSLKKLSTPDESLGDNSPNSNIMPINLRISGIALKPYIGGKITKALHNSLDKKSPSSGLGELNLEPLIKFEKYLHDPELDDRKGHSGDSTGSSLTPQAFSFVIDTKDNNDHDLYNFSIIEPKSRSSLGKSYCPRAPVDRFNQIQQNHSKATVNKSRPKKLIVHNIYSLKKKSKRSDKDLMKNKKRFRKNEIKPEEKKKFINRRLMSIVETRKVSSKSKNNNGEMLKKIKSGSEAQKARKKSTKKNKSRIKRQIYPGRAQTRGGQDCTDRSSPTNVGESAHCLRFSDLWYSVYELEHPIVEHTLNLQVFEKHTGSNGETRWHDLTQGSIVKLGTRTRQQRDSEATISFTYTAVKPEVHTFNIDSINQRLLVPLSVKSQSPVGFSEYLVVPADKISMSVEECDKAGIGFSAFVTQEDRCARQKGSCLGNQPLSFVRHDKEACAAGRSGCYFLSNFAAVSENPIKHDANGSEEYLGLDHYGPHISLVDIELRSDSKAIVKVGLSARITEVYIDSSSTGSTFVTAVISNVGLASSSYQTRISDCPGELPASWNDAKGPFRVIPPQLDYTETIYLPGQLPLNVFHCNIEVLNYRLELVALRRIKVQKMDRCFCLWHCLCTCEKRPGKFECKLMNLQQYHAAGFQGPLPKLIKSNFTALHLTKILINAIVLSAFLILVFLVLGFIKWLIGLVNNSVGQWGLDKLLRDSTINQYMEKELKRRSAMTDDDGIPIQPDTRLRTVRLCNRHVEFALNLLFFLVYPAALCCGCMGAYYRRRQIKHGNDSEIRLIKPEDSAQMICVNTYGESTNSELEIKDTEYVLNELKKSEASLQGRFQ